MNGPETTSPPRALRMGEGRPASLCEPWASDIVHNLSQHPSGLRGNLSTGLLCGHGLKTLTALLVALLSLVSSLSAQTVELRQTSVPVGIINQTTTVPLNSVQQTLTAPQTSGGYTFAYWTLNAVRWEDASGQGDNPCSFTMNSAIDAVAVYFPTTDDTDGDGLPDWWEWHYWGNLNQTASGDPDGDGFSNAEEYLRGYHPRLANVHEHGGISRRRSPNFIVIQNTATYALINETSDPAGVIQQQRVVTKGVPITTTTPPTNSAGWQFTGWLKDGLRWDKPTDFQPITFTPTTDMNLVARYTLATQDSDGDGLLDWKELLQFESLQYDNTSDPDGDGFSIAEEEARGFSTLAADELAHGGVSRRRSASFFVDTTGRFSVRQTSDPATIIEQTDYYTPGTVVTLPDKNGATFANYKFSWWDINGVRQEDASGVALSTVTFTPTGPTVATAHYVDPTVDTDGDGILDWVEWTYYGTLANNATSDTDGDGFTLADELARGQSPRVVDTLAHGGISRRRSASFFVDTTGRYSVRQTSDPATIIEQTDYYTPGTVVTLPDKNGATFANYKFSWWDINGVRQQDASGVALSTVTFTPTGPTVATAHYIDPTVDTDGDGILDWVEWTYYGSLAYGPTSDTDGDGFTLADELTRGQSPRVVDTLEHGGISRRRGVSITITPNITATPPEVGALAATNISTTTATIRAHVNPMSAATRANFEFGPTPAYGYSIASQSILNGFIADDMAADLFNLQPGTTYYYRVLATNSLGTTTSTAGSFTTQTAYTPFQVWRRTYGVSSANADDDNDGVQNLIEYAFGMNPKLGSDQGQFAQLARIEMLGGRFKLSCTQPQGVSGVIYGAQYSTDLVNWFALTDVGTGLIHEFWSPVELAGGARVFVRWAVTAP